MTSSIQQLREMIPLYLNGSLSEQQTRDFLQEISKHPELEHELAEFSDINDAFESMPMPDDANFDALFEKIDTTAVKAPSSAPTKKENYIDNLKQWLVNPFVSWGVALAQFMLVALILFNAAPEKTDIRYQSLSHTEQGSKDSISIVFTKTATVGQINTLLLELRLDIVSGPTRGKVFLIRAQDSSDVAKLLDRLRQEKIVRFAEKTLTE